MKKLIIILFLAFALTSCYMPPRFMQSSPYYDDYYVGSNAQYNSTNNNETVIASIAGDIDANINSVITNQKSHAGKKLSLTVELYAKNIDVDQKLHEALVDKISYDMYKLNKGKYDLIYPEVKIDEELEKEGLQTTESETSDLEKDLMNEYDPGIQITITTRKSTSGQIEITAKINLKLEGKQLLDKKYVIYPDNKRNQAYRSNNSARYTTTYYSYSVPLFAPAYYYWDYPGFYWSWHYPSYRYRTSYWYYRPYYRSYRTYTPSYSKTSRPSRGYYHN